MNEHERSKTDFQSNLYLQVQECYPNAQNVHYNHDMIHPAIDAQNIDAFQQTAKLYQINQVSNLSISQVTPFLECCIVCSFSEATHGPWLHLYITSSGTAQCTLLLHACLIFVIVCTELPHPRCAGYLILRILGR